MVFSHAQQDSVVTRFCPSGILHQPKRCAINLTSLTSLLCSWTSESTIRLIYDMKSSAVLSFGVGLPAAQAAIWTRGTLLYPHGQQPAALSMLT